MTFELRRTVYDLDEWVDSDEHVAFFDDETAANDMRDLLTARTGFDAYVIREL